MPQKKEKATKKSETAQQTVSICRVQKCSLPVKIIGTSPLLVHNFSSKTRREMLAKQMGKKVPAQTSKNPIEDFLDAMYLNKQNQFCVPSVSVKAAMISSVAFVKGFKKVNTKMLFGIFGIDAGDQFLMRVYGSVACDEQMVRISMGAPDIRHRPVVNEWCAQFEIVYSGKDISAEQILNLIDSSGSYSGICEKRQSAPKSCTGQNGAYTIVEPGTQEESQWNAIYKSTEKCVVDLNPGSYDIDEILAGQPIY